eukprot:scaffold27024_cov299-Cylindrotheca_fusiformis.AAC.1
MAKRLKVSTTKRAPKLVPGWEGQPKGLAQLLMERGLIDASIPYRDYRKTDCQNLLGKCSDFANEKCLMEHVAG